MMTMPTSQFGPFEERPPHWPPPPFDPPAEQPPYEPSDASSSSSGEPRPAWWPDDWDWPPKQEEPADVIVPPPLPNTTWPRLPHDHPYYLPPGYRWPDNLPPGHPGHNVRPPAPPIGSGEWASEGSGDTDTYV
jgi:hypothetical protein